MIMASPGGNYRQKMEMKMKLWTLYSIILALSSYVALDLCNHYAPMRNLRYCKCESSTGKVEGLRHLDICATRDGHYEGASGSNPVENPWKQMKWVGEASACRVKGQLIEKLDEENDFRRGYALKFTNDVEDKTHLLPWLLASKAPELGLRKRRVYLDLGANRFASSVKWFLRMYPCDFTEVHAFEVNPRQWRPPKTKFLEEANLLASEVPRSNPIRVNATPSVPDWMMERVKVYYRLVSDNDDPSKNVIDISGFIKEELKLTAADTVVVKMDIEGAEWPILTRWMDDPEMPRIIDELFVEVHYAHPTMSVFGWDSFAPISRHDASTLIADLRAHGFYAHAWP